MDPYPLGQLSPEEEARLLQIRKIALKKFRLLAVVMTICASLSICTGIAVLVGINGSGWPIVSGSPIWSGIIVLSGAICGLFLGSSNSEWATQEDRAKQRCLFVGFYSVALTSLSFCGISLGYSIWSVLACAPGFEACGLNFKYETFVNAVGVFFAFILLVFCIIVCIMFCYYKRAFKFYSYTERIDQMQRLIFQHQQTISSINHGQTPPTNYGGYGTQWVSQPPPYIEKPNVLSMKS